MLKEKLSELVGALSEVEATARKLQNQNFADIAAAAKGRATQLIDHPDLHLVQKEMDGGEAHEIDKGMPFDPNAGQGAEPKQNADNRRTADTR